MNIDFFFFFIVSKWYFYVLNYTNFTLLTILPEIFLVALIINVLILNILNISILKIYNLIIFWLILFFNYFFFLVFNYNFFFHFHFFFNNYGLFDFYSIFLKLSVIILSLFILIISKNSIYLLKKKILNEFLLLFLFAIFFIIVLFSTNDFFSSYVALEGMSFSLYIMASVVYYNKLSLECSIKYFTLGGIASAILLYGISLLFIVTNSIDFFIVKYYLLNNLNLILRFDLLIIIICLSISLFFKLSSFPCHVWSPDVYEGIWTPITAFFIIVVKTAVFVFFVRIFIYIFSNILILWQPFFLISGLGSIIIGCLGALDQYRIKRFLAYTSINQIGFLVIGLSLANIQGLASSFLFLLIYLTMNLLFFGILLNIEHFTNNLKVIFLVDLYSIDYYNIKINIIWIITFFSMAGIPPTAGFFTKFSILLNSINYSYYWLILIILFSTTISTYYYLTFIKYLLFEKKQLINLYFIDYTITFLNYLLLLCNCWILVFFIFFPVLFYGAFLLTLSCKFLLSNEFLVMKNNI
jgi:NADH-quinone oxidoreductase subunit N